MIHINRLIRAVIFPLAAGLLLSASSPSVAQQFEIPRYFLHLSYGDVGSDLEYINKTKDFLLPAVDEDMDRVIAHGRTDVDLFHPGDLTEYLRYFVSNSSRDDITLVVVSATHLERREGQFWEDGNPLNLRNEPHLNMSKHGVFRGKVPSRAIAGLVSLKPILQAAEEARKDGLAGIQLASLMILDALDILRAAISCENTYGEK